MPLDQKVTEELNRQAEQDNAKAAEEVKKAQAWANTPEAKKIFGNGDKKA